ncbi:MAG: int [Fibrobacteres bacterium]|nr:int [Fibrobacterota bacterium]
MQFLFLICHDETFTPTNALVTRIISWNAKMAKKGVLVYGNPLQPASEAKTVRVRNKKVSVKTGPFAESKDKVSAYVLVECSSIKAAVAVAASHPMAAVATLEVRPVWENIPGAF